MSKKVRIEYMGGYRIYCYDVNRHYSYIGRNNEYIPVRFGTYEEVLEKCKENNYVIVNPNEFAE